MSIAQSIEKFTNNLRTVFTDKQISPNVTYTYVQNFKDIIDFRSLLEQHLQQYDGLKAPNRENSQTDYKCNELFLLIKMIACNLQNWFKQAILPEEERCHRITTLRRTIYKTCGIIVGKGWYCHIVFQTDAAFQRIIEHIQKALRQFRLQFGTG